MTAAPRLDDREELAQWAAVILAPEFLDLLATGRTRQAVELLHQQPRRHLYALAVVLADRAHARERNRQGPHLPARLIRATAADDAAEVSAILTPLTDPELHDLCTALGGLVHDPHLRPDDGQIDEVAVYRAASGQHQLLTRRERTLAIQLLHRRGCGFTEIAERLGVTEGVVSRALYKQPVQLDLLELLEESPLA